MVEQLVVSGLARRLEPVSPRGRWRWRVVGGCWPVLHGVGETVGQPELVHHGCERLGPWGVVQVSHDCEGAVGPCARRDNAGDGLRLLAAALVGRLRPRYGILAEGDEMALQVVVVDGDEAPGPPGVEDLDLQQVPTEHWLVGPVGVNRRGEPRDATR